MRQQQVDDLQKDIIRAVFHMDQCSHCLHHVREFKMLSFMAERRKDMEPYGNFLRYGVRQKQSTKPQRSVVWEARGLRAQISIA